MKKVIARNFVPATMPTTKPTALSASVMNQPPRFKSIALAALGLGIAAFAPHTQAAIVISDNFDDGAIGTNTNGTGSGFNFLERNGGTPISAVESGGAVTVTNTTDNYDEVGIISKDALSVTSTQTVTVTWNVSSATNFYENGLVFAVQSTSNTFRGEPALWFVLRGDHITQGTTLDNTYQVNVFNGTNQNIIPAATTGENIASVAADGFSVTLTADVNGWEYSLSGLGSFTTVSKTSGAYGNSSFVDIFDGGYVAAYSQNGNTDTNSVTVYDSITVSVIPEPSGALLGGLCLLALLRRRR